MNRRSWLTLLAAWLGVSAGPAAAVAGQSTSLYTTHHVDGRRAVALWEQLRARGDGYPVILGSPDEAGAFLMDLDHQIGMAPARMEAAARLRFPQDLRALRAEKRAGIRARLTPDQKQTFDEDWATPDDGEWPEDLPAPADEPVVVRGHDNRYRDVLIVVLPARDATEALAMLGYEPGEYETVCPVEHHMAAVRNWREGWGFELVACYRGAIEGRASRRPTGREAALALAREQYEYCPDIVDQGVGSTAALAATLMVSDWWYFWWD